MFRNQWICFVGYVVLQLLFKLVYLISQVRNNVLISTDMLINHLLIWLDPHLDILCSIRILKRVYRLFILRCSW
jgi:hypothetical protein